MTAPTMLHQSTNAPLPPHWEFETLAHVSGCIDLALRIIKALPAKPERGA